MALDDAYFKLLDGLITSSEIEKLKRQYYQDGFNDGYKAGYEQRCKNDSDLTIEIKEDLEDGGKIFIEDIVKTEQNQKMNKKDDEWGYIGIVDIINQ